MRVRSSAQCAVGYGSVTSAVFGVPAGYKLDIIGADGVFREMAAGERLKVKEGMEFASHPPVGQSS